MKKRFLGIVALFLGICFTMAACSSNETAPSVEDDRIAGGSVSVIDEVTKENAGEVEKQEDSGSTVGTGSYPDGSTPQFSGVKLKLTVNDTDEVIIAMYDNTAVEALLDRLPLTNLSFFDLSNIEKPIERLEEPLSLGEEEPGYDPIAGEMVIYRPWGNFTIFYGDFRHSDELVPLGIVESGLEVIAGQTEDFMGALEVLETEE